MAKDAIFAVKEAEKEAQQLLEDAISTSKRLKEESVTKGEEEFNRILSDGRLEAKKINEDAIVEGDALAKPILEKGEQEAEDLSNLDPDKMDKAVNFIIERIVNANGYS